LHGPRRATGLVLLLLLRRLSLHGINALP